MTHINFKKNEHLLHELEIIKSTIKTYFKLLYITILYNKKLHAINYKSLNLKRKKCSIIIDAYYIDKHMVYHPIEGKEKAIITSKKSSEYKTALLLTELFKNDIHLVPRISDITNTGLSTKTPDYIFNCEKWELKTPINCKFDNSIETSVKKSKVKKQASNIIINFKNYDNGDDEIIKLAIKTLKNPARQWIKKLILIKESHVIIIISKQ